MEVKYKFKVLSYNVLSQQLLMSNPRLYRHHNPAHLNWSYRAPRLMDEFKTIDADIICLQEVEAGHIPFYNELEKCGYKGIHKKRTGDKNDGCAIYFKTARFTLIDYTTVEFQQPEASVLDRDNIGLVVKLHPVGWDEFPLVVSTTHLLYNPKRHDVKLAQMQVLLTEIERFAYNSKFSYFTYHPIILTGDFNLQPYTSVYQLLLSGSLRYDILDRKFLQMDAPSHFHMGKSLLSSRLGITDSCQHYKILKVRELEDANGFVGSAKVQERLIGIQNSDRNVHVSGIQVPDEDIYRFGSGVLSHGFNFKSVYNHADSESREPEATTHHDEWVTVDYMLYTPLKNVSSNRDQLQLVSRMRLPTVTECGKLGRIPNEACPSDHIPLVANFYLRLRKTDRHYDDRSNTRRKK
ncbi:protein angel homolog 2 isoform X2 [Nilaparvata lugens]|nr:protein angel homolog 2 isoform X2 [Nilaparvata lugens]